MKISIVFLLSLILLASCGTHVKIERTNNLPLLTKYIIKNYQLGEKVITSVGDVIITLQAEYETNRWAYRALRNYDPPAVELTAIPPNIIKGTYYYVYGQYKDDLIVTRENYNFRGSTNQVGIIINKAGFVTDGYISLTENPFIPKLQGSWDNAQLFEPNDAIHKEESNLIFTITYLGKIGNTIRLGYNEFMNNIIRKDFYMELTYNLDESRIITFRSIELEVIEATNSNIKFKVISDDNLSWVK